MFNHKMRVEVHSVHHPAPDLHQPLPRDQPPRRERHALPGVRAGVGENNQTRTTNINTSNTTHNQYKLEHIR